MNPIGIVLRISFMNLFKLLPFISLCRQAFFYHRYFYLS